MSVDSQVEGCVVDDKRQTLFFAEEDRGIWSLSLEKQSGNTTQPQLLAAVDNKILAADIEGLSLYLTGDSGYLIASNQGNDSNAAFSRDGKDFIGQFRVALNMQAGIDGSSETDGLEVTSAYLGPDYPEGLLVIQDGRNRLPSATQNFKLVGWDSVRKSLDHNAIAK
nr:phytase [uncultured Microbulbifer sp.]